MARAHARILCSILEDEDFQDLSPEAQRLYLILLAQPNLSTAGVLPLTLKRWSRACKATTVDDISKALRELDERRYVLVDEDTEECLIRSFIRNDGIAKQPQMMSNSLRFAREVVSRRLRASLADELRRLGRDDAARVADELSPPGSEPPPPDRPRSPIQAHGSLLAAAAQPSVVLPGGVGGRGKGISSSHLDQNLSSKKTSCSDSTDSILADGEPPTTPPSATAAKRGTRIPENFAVTDDMVTWARQHAPNVDGRLETEIFVDYWRAKPGKDALKLNWVLTWKNWMRRTEQRSSPRPLRTSVATADRRIAEAELLKDNPDPAVLAAAGIPIPPRLTALPGGAA